MLKKLKNRNQGFTIIEILIVLAIAALILLIIFFAVPSLQRNSRNTQMRNDGNVVLGFINDFAANNNGAIPGSLFYDNTTGNLCMIISTTAPTACASSSAAGYVGRIRAGLGAANVTFTGTVPTTDITAASTLRVVLGGKCASPTTAVGGTANPRAASVNYATETATGTNTQCVDG